MANQGDGKFDTKGGVEGQERLQKFCEVFTLDDFRVGLPWNHVKRERNILHVDVHAGFEDGQDLQDQKGRVIRMGQIQSANAEQVPRIQLTEGSNSSNLK